MDLGVVLGWINTSLLAVLGIFAYFRWKHLGFFPVYALSLFLFGLLGLTILRDHEFVLITFDLGNILCLLAVSEVWRVEMKGHQWWFGLALIPMIIVPFLPLGEYTLAYQLPQTSLTILLVLLMPAALKRGNALLIGWGINGLLTIAADIVTNLLPAFSWIAILFVYPAAFFIMSGVWLWKLLEPERARLARFLASLRLGPELATQVAGGGKAAPLDDEDFAVAAEMGLTEGAEIYRFPAGRNSLGELDSIGPHQVGGTLDEINERLESIETAMDTVVKLALERDKIFLSRSDLAVYLGVKEPVADKFVSYHDLRKIPLTGDAEDWIVFTRDVNEAIGIAD